MKRRLTGERVEIDQEDIDRELFELAREWTAVSKITNFSCHIDNIVITIPLLL
jgi:hypothetical protein